MGIVEMISSKKHIISYVRGKVIIDAISVCVKLIFFMHSDLLIMACGLNAIAQAYHHKTPLVVLPDERPHREQEVMAEALIAQGRAMSWQQFVDVSKNPPSLGNLLTSSAKPDSNRVSNNTVDETNTKTTAQALMDSFVDYPAAKSWFQDWLLPKLDMTPK